MTEFAIRPQETGEYEPLVRLFAEEEDLALVNPSAKHPFDPAEWREKWLGEADDAAFFVLDRDGREVGFFALRVGVGPEVRHLAYVFLEEEARGGAGREVAALVEEAARDLGALTVTLKVEVDNEPALATYRAAGFEELSRQRGMATMRLDLD